MSRYAKVLLPPIIFTIVLIVLVFWRGNTIERLDKSLADKNKKTQEMLTLLNNTPAMINQYAHLDSVIRSYGDDLMGIDEAIEMVRKIGRAASDHNIALVDFKFDVNKYVDIKEKARASGSYFVPFEARFKGGYIDFGKFTGTLERRKYIGNINHLQIARNPLENTEFYSIKGFVRFYERHKRGA